MSRTSERPVRGASQTGRSEVRTATKPSVSAGQDTARTLIATGDQPRRGHRVAPIPRQLIEELAAAGGEFTADEVAAMGAEDMATGMGPAFVAARRAGLITPVGTRPSLRPARRRAHLHVWRGVAA